MPARVTPAPAKHLREPIARQVARYLRATYNISAGPRHSDRLGPHATVYNTTKPRDVLHEDKLIERLPLNLRPEDVKIVPVEESF
jgi:hypothetical protein